jgi:hypothetical protein
MVERWVTTPWKDHPTGPDRFWDESDEAELIRWLRGAAHPGNKKYSDRRLLDLVAMALGNPIRSAKFKEELLNTFRNDIEALWKAKEQTDAFEYVANAVLARTSGADRLAAARLLSVFAPLSPDHAKEVRALLRVTPDEAVARELKVLLGD